MQFDAPDPSNEQERIPPPELETIDIDALIEAQLKTGLLLTITAPALMSSAEPPRGRAEEAARVLVRFG